MSKKQREPQRIESWVTDFPRPDNREHHCDLDIRLSNAGMRIRTTRGEEAYTLIEIISPGVMELDSSELTRRQKVARFVMGRSGVPEIIPTEEIHAYSIKNTQDLFDEAHLDDMTTHELGYVFSGLYDDEMTCEEAVSKLREISAWLMTEARDCSGAMLRRKIYGEDTRLS